MYRYQPMHSLKQLCKKDTIIISIFQVRKLTSECQMEKSWERRKREREKDRGKEYSEGGHSLLQTDSFCKAAILICEAQTCAIQKSSYGLSFTWYRDNEWSHMIQSLDPRYLISHCSDLKCHQDSVKYHV